jgi:dTDP-4-dehydrorhamnose reductase
MNVIVLGASGMLGAMVADVLARNPSWVVSGTVRDPRALENIRARLPQVHLQILDAEQADMGAIEAVLGRAEWAINAIGVIKPYIHDDNPAEVERATRVNALFPHRLARAAQAVGTRVLQIATDCVYSGQKGAYVETDGHDALDVYGKTKSLGEAYAPMVHHLRCSIIGPETKAHVSLLDWFLRQPPQATVSGYTNHQWNGVTTLHFARLCQGLITSSLDLPHAQHIVPSGAVSKYELLQCFAREYKRGDVNVNAGLAKTVIDRTLATGDQALNDQIWSQSGYATPPSVPEMVAEMAHFDFRLAP